MIFDTDMDTYSNARKDIYIARKKGVEKQRGSEVVIYEKPFYYGQKNYQPLTLISMQSYMSVYGETNGNVAQCLIDYSDKGLFKPFDLAYLYGATPEGEPIAGANANYVIKACRPQNTKIMVILEEIIKEEY